MNFYDLVEAKVSELAILISTLLGFIQVVCASWVLERILRSESLAYYSYGLKVGELKLAEGTRAHVEAFDLLTSSLGPLLLILKLSASLGLISGLVQIGSAAILWKVKNEEKPIGFYLWLASVGFSLLLSLSSIILPIAYAVAHSTEIRVFLVVTTLGAFLQAHLLAVLVIQFRRKFMEKTGSDQEEIAASASAAAARENLPTPPSVPAPSPALPLSVR